MTPAKPTAEIASEVVEAFNKWRHDWNHMRKFATHERTIEDFVAEALDREREESERRGRVAGLREAANEYSSVLIKGECMEREDYKYNEGAYDLSFRIDKIADGLEEELEKESG